MDDVQEILLAMRREQHEDLGKLGEKVDDGFEALHGAISEEAGKRHSHEKEDLAQFASIDSRLKSIERVRTTLWWFGATAITAVLAGAVDAFFHHMR